MSEWTFEGKMDSRALHEGEEDALLRLDRIMRIIKSNFGGLEGPCIPNLAMVPDGDEGLPSAPCFLCQRLRGG
jgi:hypothetical protein